MLQQAYVLHLATLHPDMQHVAKVVGVYKTEEINSILTKWKHLQDIVKVTAPSSQVKDDQQAFLDTILTALLPDKDGGSITAAIKLSIGAFCWHTMTHAEEGKTQTPLCQLCRLYCIYSSVESTLVSTN